MKYKIRNIMISELLISNSNNNSITLVIKYYIKLLSLNELFNFNISNVDNNSLNTLNENGELILLILNVESHFLCNINAKDMITLTEAIGICIMVNILS
jgi:hypothetical protein